jgi:hypothetical protein
MEGSRTNGRAARTAMIDFTGTAWKSAHVRARDSSGNSADYACTNTSVWEIPGRARNDNEGMSGIGADSPVGHAVPHAPEVTRARF